MLNERRELNRPIITTREDVDAQIVLPHEREYALFLLGFYPEILFTYESVRFEHRTNDGRILSTVPDFDLLFMGSGQEQFHELSAAEEREGYDPKRRQREFMRTHFPDVNYRVFDPRTLIAGQAIFVQVDFRGAIQQHRSTDPRHR